MAASASRSLAWLGGVALVAGSFLLSGPASAHSYLVASTPAEGETVTTAPDQFSVTANEPLLDLSGDASGFAIQVVDAAGAFYGDGCFTVSGSTLSMGATLGEAGSYRMYWQVISSDGHPVSGEVPFTWAPAAEAQISAGRAAPPVCGEAEPGPEPTPTGSPTDEATSTPTDEPSAAPEPQEQNWFMTALTDPMFIGLAVLAILSAIAVILLGVRAYRGMRKDDGSDDDTWNAPPSQ